jgi:hypothetical protein
VAVNAGESIEQSIARQFPNLANVYKPIPEVWNILIWAATTSMAPEQVQAAIQNSNYYRSRTNAQQKWDATTATNPAEVNRILEQNAVKVRNFGVDLGANLTDAQVKFIAYNAAMNGWNAQELHDSIVGYTAGLNPNQRNAGEFTAAMTKVRSIADEYAMPVNDTEAVRWAKGILTGGSGEQEHSEANLRAIFTKRAQSLYPSLRDELEDGVTVAQWAQPYKNVAAQELGVSPDAITFNDPKWKAMLEGNVGPGATEGKSKTIRPMSLAQWQTMVRTDSRYGYDQTVNGKSAAYGIADAILSAFGKRA